LVVEAAVRVVIVLAQHNLLPLELLIQSQ
jgi:hypothetical protein